MNKKLMIVLLVVVMLSMALSACGKDGGLVDQTGKTYNACGDLIGCVDNPEAPALWELTCKATGGVTRDGVCVEK